MNTTSRHKLFVFFSLLVIASLAMAACAGPPEAPAPAADADQLATIMARGTLVISTDPAYPPQSELVEGVTREANTKCAADEHTANEFHGFDIDTAVEIAKRLGVEPCFVTPDWTLITGGSWADRWDVSVGSVTITPERMDPLYFTQPYYTTPAAFFINADNTTFSAAADLNGKKIGVCGGCTYESYLAKDLSIPGENIDFIVNDAGVTTYDTDTSALQDLALGDGVRLDAVLTAKPTGDQAISDGMPLKQLGDPVFFEYLAAAVDKSASNDPISLVKRLNEIINAMHSDGTLKALSQEYFGSDLTTAAGAFDVNALGQLP